jgi:hypothetical protein
MSDDSLSDVASLRGLSGDESVSMASEDVQLERNEVEVSEADDSDEEDEEEESEEEPVPEGDPPVMPPAPPAAPADGKKRRHSVDIFLKKKAIQEFEGGQVSLNITVLPCLAIIVVLQISKKKLCKKYRVKPFTFDHSWMKKKEKIFADCESVRKGQLGKRKRVRGGGRRPKFIEFEKALWAWFKNEKVHMCSLVPGFFFRFPTVCAEAPSQLQCGLAAWAVFMCSVWGCCQATDAQVVHRVPQTPQGLIELISLAVIALICASFRW